MIDFVFVLCCSSHKSHSIGGRGGLRGSGRRLRRHQLVRFLPRCVSLCLKFMYCSAFQYSAGTGRRFSVPSFICRAHSHRPVDGRRVEAAGWAQLFEGHRERGKCERTQKMNYPSAAQVRPIIRGLSASLARELHAPLVPSRFFFFAPPISMIKAGCLQRKPLEAAFLRK